MTMIDTTFLRRCIGALERALDGLGAHSGPDDFLHDIYRAACVKEFELVLEQSDKLLRKRLAAFFASNRQADRLAFKDLFRHAARPGMIEAGLVDCMVALPGQFFYSTQIPARLWFLARHRKRRGEILFVDARALGRMVDGTHRELTNEDIARIAGAYHAWRGSTDGYEGTPGFCKSAALEEMRRCGRVLTPGRYVGAPPPEDDGEPFEDKMKRLLAQLREQQAEGARLDRAIEANLQTLGFGMNRENAK